MKIAVNVRWLLPNKLEGTGIYTLRMLEQILPAAMEHEFLLLWDRPSAMKGMRDLFSFLNAPNITHKLVLPPARHPWLWWYWNSIGVPVALKRWGAARYWSPDGLPARTKIKQWLTIHDLNFEHHPEWIPPHVGRYYRTHIRRGARMAEQLFTVSEWSARDLVETYGVAAGKIVVTPNAPQRPMSPGESRFEENYFCAVGALTPRKNLITLLKAWDLWLEKHPERRGFLLNIAGNAHFKDPIFESAMGDLKHLDTVKWLGRLEDDALEQLYRGAIAFCMPSAMEGFGIPVVEAMQCGTPVMASNNSALTEVVGDAGMLLPTFDVEAWADGLEAMASGSGTTGEGGENWSEKGLIRGGQFTWSASAAPWLEVLKSASE